MMTTTYPMIPTLSPRTTDEGAVEFGLRAFAFLTGERLSACVLATDVLELALHASQVVVTGADTHETARDVLHAVRLDIMATIARRERETADAEQLRSLVAARAAAPDPPHKHGGARVPVRRPSPIMPPAAGALRTM